MIVADPFWKYVEENEITFHTLFRTYDLIPVDLFLLKANYNFNLQEIERLCHSLRLTPDQIFTYIKDDFDPTAIVEEPPAPAKKPRKKRTPKATTTNTETTQEQP